MEQKTAVLLITHCGLLFDHAWCSAALCSPSHSPHTFPPKNAARCDGLCSALHRPSQRAAMRDAPHYVFCLALAHDLPPCAPGLHPTLSAPPQSQPYSYQKCGRRDWAMREDGMKNRPGTRTHTRQVKPASAPNDSQKRSDGLFPRRRYLSSENALGGLTGRFRGVLRSMCGLPHGSLQRTEAVIAVIVPVHHAAQMMLAGETALVTQRPGIVIGTTTPPCFCSRRDWHAEVKQSSMRTARAVIFRQVFGITFLPSCSKVQAGRRER